MSIPFVLELHPTQGAQFPDCRSKSRELAHLLGVCVTYLWEGHTIQVWPNGGERRVIENLLEPLDG